MMQSRDRRALRPFGAALALAVIVGGFLRYGMLWHGLWRDEASTVFDALGGTWHDVLQRVAYCELNPPGFFLFMHLWLQHVPLSDVLVKLPAAIASLLLIPLCAILGSRIGGPQLAAAAGWCAALAPMDLYYAQEARPYMFAACFTVTALIGLLDLLDRRPGYLPSLVFVVGLVGGMYMQYTGGLLAITLFAIWAIIALRRREIAAHVVPFIACAALVLLAGLALVPALAVEMHAGLSWDGPISLKALPGLSVADMFVLLPLDWFPVHKVLKALVVIALIGEALYSTYIRRRFVMPGGYRAAIVLLTALVIAILESPVSNQARYMVPFSPLFWVVFCGMLIAGFSADAQRRKIGYGLVIAFLALMWVFDLTTIKRDRGTLKSGAAQLRQVPIEVDGTADVFNAADARVLTVPDLLAPTVGYYLQGTLAPQYGFARWDQPQLFSPLGYAALWNSPDIVGRTLAKVAALPTTGARHLVLLSMPTADSGSLPYSKGIALVQALRARYSCERHLVLFGKIETLNVDVLQLDQPQRQPQC